MQAIILAGGLGTRLRALVSAVPKPMAPIHAKPFLAYLLEYLKSQGIDEVILSVHYLSEHIEAYFQGSYHGITIQYAHEEQPLGTGGAILNALQQVTAQEPVFVVNGDTFLKLNYPAMLAVHQKNAAALTIALRPVNDCTRYGSVILENDQVIAFKEQGAGGPGLINAGVYLMQPQLFEQLRQDEAPLAFSFERDFLHHYVTSIKPQAFIVNGYFIDIGIPADYLAAQRTFLEQLGS